DGKFNFRCFPSELSVVETSKNEALSEEFDPKEYDKNVDDSEYPSSSMAQLLQAAAPEQTSFQMLAYALVDLNLPNLNESQVNEYAEFDFDNPENDSLSDMVKTGEEYIHLYGLETVDDPFVQTPN
nr:hypothetical protein [Tanacetum cinerariifolium]